MDSQLQKDLKLAIANDDAVMAGRAFTFYALREAAKFAKEHDLEHQGCLVDIIGAIGQAYSEHFTEAHILSKEDLEKKSAAPNN